MLLILVAAVFGNLGQLQLKYDHCKSEKFEGEYCKIEKVLFEKGKKPIKKYNFYKDN